MASTDRQHQFYEMLLESQYWPGQKLQDFQRNQLGQLLRHARANVPFYAGRLDAVFTPSGDIDWDRWGELPVTKRADLASRGEQMKALVAPAGHGPWTSTRTTGSSGQPIVVTSNQLAHAANGANRFRSYGWHAIDWGRDLLSVFGDDKDVAAYPEGKIAGHWGPRWDVATQLGTWRQLNRFTEIPHIIAFMRRTATSYLGTGSKTGLAIALEAERLGLELRLDAFMPQGSTLGETERDAMMRVFGARTAELYSSKEAGQIAHGCPDADGLHVNAESVLLEIVDEAGKPCGPHQPGRVLVTPLFNSAQPLIRYEQGDVAEWLPACSCGRHLPRIGGLIGRTTGLFYHPDGRVRAAFLRAADKALIGAREWQIAQVGPHEFEVRFVPVRADAARNETALADRIRQLYFDDARVVFLPLGEIPTGPGGKHVEYVNEWKPAGR